MMSNEELLSVIGVGIMSFGLILFLIIVTLLPEIG